MRDCQALSINGGGGGGDGNIVVAVTGQLR